MMKRPAQSDDYFNNSHTHTNNFNGVGQKFFKNAFLKFLSLSNCFSPPIKRHSGVLPGQTGKNGALSTCHISFTTMSFKVVVKVNTSFRQQRKSGDFPPQVSAGFARADNDRQINIPPLISSFFRNLSNCFFNISCVTLKFNGMSRV
jgi:hypothetical protein